MLLLLQLLLLLLLCALRFLTDQGDKVREGVVAVGLLLLVLGRALGTLLLPVAHGGRVVVRGGGQGGVLRGQACELRY